MVLTAIFQLSAYFVSGWVNLTAGVSTIPSGLSSAISYFFSALGYMDYLIPVDSLLGALYIVAIFEGAIWTFRGAVWIYRHIPFIGH